MPPDWRTASETAAVRRWGSNAAAARGISLGSVVVVGSNSVTTHPGYPLDIAEWCLAQDETKARQGAAEAETSGVYAASKLALSLWSRRQATTHDWIGEHIRLNVIAPGFIETEMTAVLPEETKKEYLSQIPAARYGSVGEIAKTAAWLASDDAGYISGAVIPVVGGLGMGH